MGARQEPWPPAPRWVVQVCDAILACKDVCYSLRKKKKCLNSWSPHQLPIHVRVVSLAGASRLPSPRSFPFALPGAPQFVAKSAGTHAAKSIKLSSKLYFLLGFFSILRRLHKGFCANGAKTPPNAASEESEAEIVS